MFVTFRTDSGMKVTVSVAALKPPGAYAYPHRAAVMAAEFLEWVFVDSAFIFTAPII